MRPDDTTLLQHVMDPRRGSEVIIRELVVPALRDSFDDIAAAADGADLVLSHPITFAAPLVAETRGLPWMAIGAGAAVVLLAPRLPGPAERAADRRSSRDSRRGPDGR